LGVSLGAAGAAGVVVLVHKGQGREDHVLVVFVVRRLCGVVVDSLLDQVEARGCFFVFSSSGGGRSSSSRARGGIIFLRLLVHNGELQLDFPLEHARIQDRDERLDGAIGAGAVLVLVTHQGGEGLAHDGVMMLAAVAGL
jgi:hypothetical protein